MTRACRVTTQAIALPEPRAHPKLLLAAALQPQDSPAHLPREQVPSTYFRSRSQRLQPWNPYLTSQGINQSSLFSLKFSLLRTTVNANTAEISPCCMTPSVQESPKAWACSISFWSPDDFFLHHQLFLPAGHHLRGVRFLVLPKP